MAQHRYDLSPIVTMPIATIRSIHHSSLIGSGADALFAASRLGIDPENGEIKWEYKNDGLLWAGIMTTAGGPVFTGTPEGFLIALGLQEA